MSAAGFLERLVIGAGIAPPARAAGGTGPASAVRPLIAPLFAAGPADAPAELSEWAVHADVDAGRGAAIDRPPIEQGHRGPLVAPPARLSDPTPAGARASDAAPLRELQTDRRPATPPPPAHPAIVTPAAGLVTPVGDSRSPAADRPPAHEPPPRQRDDARMEPRRDHESVRLVELRTEQAGTSPGTRLAPQPGEAPARRSMMARDHERATDGAGAAPVVHVTIGRVEIRTAPPARQAGGHHRQPAADAATSSLDTYLADRAERARR